MSFVKRLWDQEFVRYLAMGGVNTAITYVAYLLILPFMNYQVAYGLTYVMGVFTSYALNARFVFRQPLDWRKALQFPIVFIVQYVLAALFLELFVRLGMSAELAGLVSIAPTVPITFLISRFLLKPKEKAAV